MLDFRIIDHDSCNYRVYRNNSSEQGVRNANDARAQHGNGMLSATGCEICGEEFTAVGIPHYEMRKNLIKSI